MSAAALTQGSGEETGLERQQEENLSSQWGREGGRESAAISELVHHKLTVRSLDRWL